MACRTTGNKYKVGDEVKISGESTGGCEKHRGKKGVVNREIDSDGDVRVAIDDCDTCDGFHYFKPENLVKTGKKRKSTSSEGTTTESVINPFYGDIARSTYIDFSRYANWGPMEITWSPEVAAKPKKRMARKVNKLAASLLDEDTQALIKVGILDDELELTEDGEEAIMSKLFLQLKAELAKDAKAELAKEDARK